MCEPKTAKLAVCLSGVFSFCGLFLYPFSACTFDFSVVFAEKWREQFKTKIPLEILP